MLSEYTCDQLHGRDASVPFWWKYLHRIRRYWHFSKFNISGAAILGFHDTWIWHASSWFSASWAVIPSLVQISRTIADNNPHFIPDVRLMTSCKLTSGSDFGDVNIYAWSFYILVPFFGKISSTSTEIIASWSCWGKSWDHPRRPIQGGYPL